MEEYKKIFVGNSHDNITIHREFDVLIIDIHGAPDGDEIIESMVLGLNSGMITTSSPTLVDVTEYTGTIDWGAIKFISLMKDWGDPTKPPTPVAIVHKSKLFMFVMKVVGIFFPRSQMALFETRSAAWEWVELTHLKNSVADEMSIEVSTHYERKNDVE